jgi:hypothetical protein
MGKVTRKRYSADFKARVALEAINEVVPGIRTGCQANPAFGWDGNRRGK